MPCCQNRIFGLEGAEAEDALYVNWIDVVFAGLEALKMYDPKTGSWLQVSCQALSLLLQNFAKILYLKL